VVVGLTLADSAALSSQLGNTALSRGVKDNRLFFAGPRPVDPEHHLPEEEAPAQDKQQKLLAAGLARDRSKELAGEVIAALDPDDHMAVKAALAAAIQETQQAAAAHNRAAQGRQVAEEAAAIQATEAAKTSEEREEEQRRERDAEFDKHRQQQDRGRQRRRTP
jgi:hypothetical protein